MATVHRLRGFLFVCFLYYTCLIGTIVVMGPTLILLCLQPRWFRWVDDNLIAVWLVLPPALLEMMFGVKVIVTGDKPPKSENSVIIMNHRCRLDWMFFWSYMARYGELKHEKIIMKHELKHIPGPGWAMQNALYIFLCRRWEKDESYLNSVLSYFVNSSDSLQLLLFPEGTNFEEASKQKSDSFASKNNLPFYNYVLHPRVRGFTYCIEKLRQGNLDAILDVTVGYSDNYCFEEVDLLKGNVPSEIHFHIQRYSNDTLPQDTQGLEEWCCKQWKEKEERLKKFYTQEKHFGPPSEIASEQQSEVQLAVSHLFKKGLLFWLVFTICSSVLMYTSAMVRWYVLIIGIVYLVLSLLGGTDKIFLQLMRKSTDTKTK
ncbi:lysocardiolipin acyltransferase 1-like isoform X1 [Stylophora pistillata]|uniref:Lysocardiolipin acyltransferase 1 n=2 Tax=Stylophora pistillata TaxID=50429 RepID=A0A2B4SYD7_STYPI|nr:lysocardiolipin acyltransferase 1-like isoform X1 [Stylophora pistillata]PFX34921.1 Lysocardiolipin acyltransferase 1 [Stylophora pistillata]